MALSELNIIKNHYEIQTINILKFEYEASLFLFLIKRLTYNENT